MPASTTSVPVNSVTQGPRHHFFGYYDKTPWDESGRYLLSLETAFVDRMPRQDDTAVIGFVDLANGNAFSHLSETRAWNMQQGCMLQWLANAPKRTVIFNDREGDHFVSIVLDVNTGETRTLPRPIYNVSHSGKLGITLNFSRLNRLRPVTGYAGVQDGQAASPCPSDDGIYLMDLDTGDNRLIISLAQIAAHDAQASMDEAEHWFEHLLFNPDDSRFLFLHRWRPAGQGRFLTRLFTAAPDGSDIYCVADHDMVSHFDWKDASHILAWARQRDVGDRYYLFADRTSEVAVIGEGVLTQDGHCTFSPDGQWILTDTYPDAERMYTLIMYRLSDGRRFDIGRFFAPPHLVGDIRCDSHPRWSPSGTQVCIDSAHEGERQVYVLDVGEIVNGSESKSDTARS